MLSPLAVESPLQSIEVDVHTGCNSYVIIMINNNALVNLTHATTNQLISVLFAFFHAVTSAFSGNVSFETFT